MTLVNLFLNASWYSPKALQYTEKSIKPKIDEDPFQNKILKPEPSHMYVYVSLTKNT